MEFEYAREELRQETATAPVAVQRMVDHADSRAKEMATFRWRSSQKRE